MNAYDTCISYKEEMIIIALVFEEGDTAMRIGIITQYYKSLNYGGNLQAYALCKVIEDMGYIPTQIKFIRNTTDLTNSTENELSSTLHPVKQGIINRVIRRVQNYIKYLKTKKLYDNMNFSFENWRCCFVSDSDEIYTDDSIHKCVENYDVFITGSDQVWNLKWYSPIYFLGFVPSEYSKISYAASMCQSSLNDYQKQVIRDMLKDFSAISVRERDSVDVLKDVAPVEVEYTLDPTLLLDSDEWGEISSERLIREPYVYCYFLAYDKKQINLAVEYARKHNIKIAVIQNMMGRTEKKYDAYADYKVKYANPSDFLSLIKYAEYIFTDSFHATVFSALFNKEVAIFKRTDEQNMQNRLYCIAELFGIEDRFLDSDEKISFDYIDGLNRINYSKNISVLMKIKKKSLDFLKSNLYEAEERRQNED